MLPCLTEGMLFLISIPRVLSPGRNKALAPHWTEQTASLQHSRRILWWLKPWEQGTVTKREEKDSKKKRSPCYPCRKDGHISAL